MKFQIIARIFLLNLVSFPWLGLANSAPKSNPYLDILGPLPLQGDLPFWMLQAKDAFNRNCEQEFVEAKLSCEKGRALDLGLAGQELKGIWSNISSDPQIGSVQRRFTARFRDETTKKIVSLGDPIKARLASRNANLKKLSAVLQMMRQDFEPAKSLSLEYFRKLREFQETLSSREAELSALLNSLNSADVSQLYSIRMQVNQLLSGSIGLTASYRANAGYLYEQIAKISQLRRADLDRIRDFLSEENLTIPDFFEDLLVSIKNAEASLLTRKHTLSDFMTKADKDLELLLERKVLLQAEENLRPEVKKIAEQTASSRFFGAVSVLRKPVFGTLAKSSLGLNFYEAYVFSLLEYQKSKYICSDVTSENGAWKALGCGLLIQDLRFVERQLSADVLSAMKVNHAVYSRFPKVDSSLMAEVATALGSGDLLAASRAYDLGLRHVEQVMR
jgi:hypothetical protein